MFRIGIASLLLPVLAWAFSGAKPKVTPPGTLRVYFSANREGELEPCGCQVHQLGGFDRLVTFMGAEKPGTDGKVFVEAGDSFFSLPEMEKGRLEREKLKARLMAEFFFRLKLDAFCPGERDFAAGLPFLKELEKESGATFVAANLEDGEGKHPFKASRLVERAGLKVGIIGIVGKEALSRVGGVKVSDPISALKSEIEKLHDSGAHAIIVLSHQGLEADKQTAAVEGVDLVVSSHSLDPLADPIRVKSAAIVQTQNQGQQIGSIRLKFPEREFSDHKVFNLDSDTPSDKAVLDAITKYKEVVRQTALKQSSNVPPVTDASPYVANSGYCRNCHTKQYDFWATTKHASAILVLYAKNQIFDPECIGCHTLGFDRPGGFSNITQPLVFDPPKKKKGAFVETFLKEVFQADTGSGPLDSRKDPARHKKLHDAYWKSVKKLEGSGTLARNYLGVQCEHCHGNRAGHPASEIPTVKKVSEVSCKNCHTPPHAAPYDPAKFQSVACPISSKM